jgi:hypothetical protein
MIIIMGPGRCGTTFWLRLFEELGFDNGGAHEIFRERPEGVKRADFKWPYVIKGTGTLCAGLNRWVEERGWKVDHVYLCVRELEANLKSMIKKKEGQSQYRSLSKDELDSTLRREILVGYGNALNQIVVGGYTFTVVQFPRSAYDKDYAYKKFCEGPVDVERDKFYEAREKVLDINLINFGG